MANRSIISIESFDEYDVVVVDDLSNWEFIDPSLSSDGEDMDSFSFTEEEHLLDDVVLECKEEDPYEIGSPSSDIFMESLLTELQRANLDVLFGSPSSGISMESLLTELQPANLDVLFGSPSSDISVESLPTELQPANLDVLFGSRSSDISMESLLTEMQPANLDVLFGSPSSDISPQSLLTELQPANLDVLFGSPSSDISLQSLRIEPQPPNLVYDQDQEEDGGEYDYEDDYDDGYDLDDELVPLEVSGKLGRQRIRKLGKRACPRMNRSKRLPYYYNRPGCVRGKHGLGVQHAYI